MTNYQLPSINNPVVDAKGLITVPWQQALSGIANNTTSLPATSIVINSIAYNKIQQASANTVLGNSTASTGDVIEIATTGTGSVARAISPIFTTPNIGDATGNVSGSASQLQTARLINGVAFDGTANITIPAVAAANSLTGTTLASNVVNSSLQTVAVISSGTWNGVLGPVDGSALTGLTANNIGGQVRVINGGTQRASLTAYALLAGGVTSTSEVQSLASNGTSGQILTSNGASALPTFQTAAAVSAGALTGTTLAANVVSSSLTSLGTITTLTAGTINATTTNSTTILAGASGTAGTLDVFPVTAARGKIEVLAANNAGNTTTTITNASQAGARTYTLDDVGASASFVMTGGTQTIGGSKTWTGTQTQQSNTTFTNGTLQGWVWQQSSHTETAAAPYQLVTSESAKVITGTNAGTQNAIDLPSALGLAGWFVIFVSSTAVGMKIRCKASQFINWAGATSVSNGDISCTELGASVTLMAINNTNWVVTAIAGTWVLT